MMVLLITALVLVLTTGVIVDFLICLHMVEKHRHRILFRLQSPRKQTEVKTEQKQLARLRE